MKIKFFMMALLALGLAGCAGTNQYSGAPSPGYDTDWGQGRSSLIKSNAAPTYPEGSYFLWQNRGITPTTP